MFGESNHLKRAAEALLEVQDFNNILDENNLTQEDVLTLLIERGLIEVWIDVGPS